MEEQVCNTSPVPRVYAPKRTLIAVRVSPEGIKALDKLAKKYGITRSAVVRAALSDYIKRRAA